MCKEDMDHDCNEWKKRWKREECCREGVQGVPGLMGPQGIQGVPGEQGIMGPAGVQGVQGLQGPKGDPGHCDCHDCPDNGGCVRYADIFSNVPQNVDAYLGANDFVRFETSNQVSAGDFDLTNANITGAIKFLKHGIYVMEWELEGRVAPPIPVPVPSFSFSFFKNGVIIPGSTTSGFTQSPADDGAHISATVIVEVMANDEIFVRNTSNASVLLIPSMVGAVFPITIASVNISCLKALP